MSLKFCFGRVEEVTKFVEFGIWGGEFEFESPTTLGVENENGEIIGGVVYHNMGPYRDTIEMSAFSKSRAWTNKEIIDQIWGIPFREWGCRLVVARHSEHNRTARRIWRALGASEYKIPELRAKGEAECLAVLTREQWENSKFRRNHG